MIHLFPLFVNKDDHHAVLAMVEKSMNPSSHQILHRVIDLADKVAHYCICCVPALAGSNPLWVERKGTARSAAYGRDDAKPPR
jgi:hypothetical protein